MNFQLHYTPLTEQDLSEEQLGGRPFAEVSAEVETYFANLIREERNRLLSQSDWTQTVDAPLTAQSKEAWATYRQALRDFMVTLDFSQPFTLDDGSFPTKPE